VKTSGKTRIAPLLTPKKIKLKQCNSAKLRFYRATEDIIAVNTTGCQDEAPEDTASDENSQDGYQSSPTVDPITKHMDIVAESPKSHLDLPSADAMSLPTYQSDVGTMPIVSDNMDELNTPLNTDSRRESEGGPISAPSDFQPHLGTAEFSHLPLFDYNASGLTLSENESLFDVPNENAIISNSNAQTAPQYIVSEGIVSNILPNPSTLLGDALAHRREQMLLLRFFTEEIAHRFDISDQECHFRQVVPQRARSCPLLLNAILTLSTRHLVRLPKHRNEDGIIEWQGNLFPDLKEETALIYHNACIRELLELRSDSTETLTENSLAAAVILRTDEEMNPFHDEEAGYKEVFLRVLNSFIYAQVPDVAVIPPGIYQSRQTSVQCTSTTISPAFTDHNLYTSPGEWGPSGSNVPFPRVDGLRQSSFWVAFRQELIVSFINQRCFTFPLSRCDPFRDLSPTGDGAWANRLITFCADALEYCYGSSEDPCSLNERNWSKLKEREKKILSSLPSSFEPVYQREPGLDGNLPEIWYLSPCHVTGVNHLELARILLAASDPTMPKLGRGYKTAIQDLSSSLKTSVLKICGTAMCNQRLPSAFIEAFMAITICGEYFDDRNEQAALLDVLEAMEEEHAFPSNQTREKLKMTWGWLA
jgi:Fungal specific transcription factor domain